MKSALSGSQSYRIVSDLIFTALDNDLWDVQFMKKEKGQNAGVMKSSEILFFFPSVCVYLL